MKKYLFNLLLCSMLFAVGCSKDEGSEERIKFRYEVSGSLTTIAQIQFTPSFISIDHDYSWEEYAEESTLPWNKDVELSPLMINPGVRVTVDDAIPGQEVNVKMYREGELMGEHSGRVNADGHLHLGLDYDPAGGVKKSE